MKVDLHENPVRVIRLREHKTIKEFSEICNVHYQALYLTECGVHPTPLRSILAECVDLGYDEEWILDEYHKFVHQQRFKFKQDHSPFTLPPVDMGYSPVTNWRQSLGLTRTRFCKELCVQPALQTRLETGKAQKLYEQLKEALLEIEFPVGLLIELEDRIIEYYYFIR